MTDHFNVPCEPAGARDQPLPVALRSLTVVVGPGKRQPLTATVFVDDAFTASYSLEHSELPRFLHWMGDYCEQAAVPLNFAVVGKTNGQGDPLPCPPPAPPPEVELAARMLQANFDHVWKVTTSLFGRARDK